MAIVGSAQVLIRPTFSNMQKEIRRELEGMGEDVGAHAGERAGKSLGDRLATWGKRGAVVAGGAIAGVAGTALVKGFGRLRAIENAQATMRGLGHDTDAVRQIMNNALASVKGTAFGLGEAATIAASAVAAGIEPGEALTGHLSNVANNAAAAGISMEEMGQVFNRAATQANGVQNDVISQLADRGIPIYQALADQMGVTAGEVFKLASEGKVDFETFSAAAEQAAGNVSAEMGGTLTGSFQNTLAALGRVGANLLSGIYPYFADFFQGVMDWLGPVEDKAAEFGDAIGQWMSRAAEGVKTFIGEFRAGEGLGGQFRTVVEQVGSAIQTAFGFVKDTVIPALQDMWEWVKENKDVVLALVGGVLAAAAAFKAIMVIKNVIGMVKLATVAIRGLNLALLANPIGIVVAAIGLLVAGFILAWQRSETFREVVTAAWEGIKAAGVAVWDWLKGAFEWIKEGLSSVGQWFTDRGGEIAAAWEWMRAAIATGWEWIDTNVLTPIKAGLQVLSDVWAVHMAILGAGWDWVRGKLGEGWAWIDKHVFAPVRFGIALVKAGFDLAKDGIGIAWDAVKSVLKAGWDWIDRNVFVHVRTGADLIKQSFDLAKDGIGIAWDAVQSVLKSGWDWINDKVFAPFGRGIDTLVGWVRTGKDNIGSAWDGIKALFAAPINWVIDNVWNDGIARVFNSVAEAIGVGTRIPEISRINTGGGTGRSSGRGRASVVARAKGGWTRPGWVLVGEEGPELVNFSAPGRVYTADETQAMLAGQASNPVQGAFSASNPPHGGIGGWFGDRWDDIKSGARWVADGVRDAAGNVLKWVRGGLAKAAEVVFTPIRSLIDSTLGSGSGQFGQLVSGVATSSIDGLMDWIRGHDEGAAPDSNGRSLRGAQPHVNNAAWALADAVGGIRQMQAFNQSMAGGHPKGLAVDFIDSVSKLNRLAEVISGGGHFDNFNYMAWQARLWSPGGGWRPQGRGYGNDPMHRWHLHAEWYDRGGMLKPGMGMYANATGSPEPVLTQKQWRDVSTLAARGAGGPRHVVLRVGDREFDAYMSEVADGRIGEAKRRARISG